MTRVLERFEPRFLIARYRQVEASLAYVDALVFDLRGALSLEGDLAESQLYA